MFALLDIQIPQPMLAVLTYILIAAVSSWITVRLSMRRFRAEWLWRKKADAYSVIIEALHNLKALSIAHMKSLKRGRELSQETADKLALRASQGRDAIQKSIHMGSFLLCHKALERLERYMKELETAGEDDDWYVYLERSLGPTESCLKDIVPIAQEDLDVRKTI